MTQLGLIHLVSALYLSAVICLALSFNESRQPGRIVRRMALRWAKFAALTLVLAVAVMLFAAKPISDFVDAHPTIKILALSFLILVGVTLIVEGFDVHVPKGYIYFAMAFSVSVEMINLRLRKKEAKPIRLRKEIRAEIADFPG